MNRLREKSVPPVYGYSIWLRPAAEHCRILQESIHLLSSALLGPIFTPHITLLGQLRLAEHDIIPKFRTLSRGIYLKSVRVAGIGQQEQYYRALYLEIVKSRQLEVLNHNARNIFDLPDEPPFFPHLSLYYGYRSSSLKEKALKLLPQHFPDRLEIVSIDLVHTEGEVNAWEVVERVNPIK